MLVSFIEFHMYKGKDERSCKKLFKMGFAGNNLNGKSKISLSFFKDDETTTAKGAKTIKTPTSKKQYIATAYIRFEILYDIIRYPLFLTVLLNDCDCNDYNHQNYRFCRRIAEAVVYKCVFVDVKSQHRC